MIGQRAKLALNAGWSLLLLLLLLVHTVLLAVLFVRGPAVAMLMSGGRRIRGSPRTRVSGD
ncbi:MAG: hypothetical protein LH605_00215 [Microbacteriaceae bacterium]|nr:hypothetical protein [Microbacteriaceae bacterium]